MSLHSALDALKRFGEVALGLASLMETMKWAAHTLMDFSRELRLHLVRELLPGTGFTVERGQLAYRGVPVARRKKRLRKKLERRTTVYLRACIDAALA